MSTSSKAPARAFAIIMVIAAATAAAYFLIVKAPPESANKWYDVARKIGKDMDDLLHFRPRITSGATTLLREGGSIQELSTIEKRFDHTYTWKSTWLGSTKRIELKGNFIGKAGYDFSGKDITAPFSIDISEDGKTIRAQIPPARVNSVEQLKMEIVKDENGMWNRIDPKERQNAMNALLKSARSSFEKSGILEEADKAFLTQVEDVIRKRTSPEVEILREPLP